MTWILPSGMSTRLHVPSAAVVVVRSTPSEPTTVTVAPSMRGVRHPARRAPDEARGRRPEDVAEADARGDGPVPLRRRLELELARRRQRRLVEAVPRGRVHPGLDDGAGGVDVEHQDDGDRIAEARVERGLGIDGRRVVREARRGDELGRVLPRRCQGLRVRRALVVEAEQEREGGGDGSGSFAHGQRPPLAHGSRRAARRRSARGPHRPDHFQGMSAGVGCARSQQRT